MFFSRLGRCLLLSLPLLLGACDDETPPVDGGLDADLDADSPTDTDLAVDADADSDRSDDGGVDADPDEELLPALEVPPPPAQVATVESKARGFRLYYRERVDRALVAYNRFVLFGDSVAATNIGKAAVVRSGDEVEIIPGPVDNNRIGAGTWAAYNAWRLLPDSRKAELTLLRSLEGLVFFEAVSGHPGLTSREVYPGWTRTMDGVSGVVSRSRGGEPLVHPAPPSPALEAEVLATFYDGLVVTYREDPGDFLFRFAPVAFLEGYAVTHSFDELPRYLRVSDCCSSLMRTPEPELWAGAYWGNHNSRDNFPDLALGFLAARAVADDDEAPSELRDAAARALSAGQRVGDLILANDVSLMTVDEHHDYQTLVASGTVRPDGETESQDLGQFGVCSAAFLAQAISTDGLRAPTPPIALPGSFDVLFLGDLDFLFECEVPEEGVTCRSLDDAWCGLTWGTFHRLRVLGDPILELMEAHPEMAPTVLESFQDDFDEMTIGALALVEYGRIIGDDELYEQARATLYHVTWWMQQLADLAFADRPDRRAEQHYRAALYQAQGALPPVVGDLADFAPAEAQMVALESLLGLGEAPPAPLITDEEITERVEARLAGSSATVQARYRAEYGETPPLRRSGEGYEARGTPLDRHPWAPVETPHHHWTGGLHLLQALPLCEGAPQLLDCSWARLGCVRPDLDDSGGVDAADRAAFESAREASAGATCDEGNAWCVGADLDRDGAVTAEDEAFMEAAQGCSRSPSG